MRRSLKTYSTSISNAVYVRLLGLHAVIGFLIYLYEPLGTLYFFSALGYFLYSVLKSGNRQNQALIAAAYMTTGEVIFRMTASNIPYETGKYCVICFLVIGLFYTGTSRKSIAYWIYILLLVPGIIYAAITLDFATNIYKAIVFNISGPMCLGIAALYCYDRRITRVQMHQVLWALLTPTVTLAVYLFFYTPDTRDVLTGTGSNFALSGGFGPNQVATVLGLGMFVCFVQLFVNTKNKLIFFLNLGLLMFLSYRAIITFSRGGVITAVVVSIAFLVVYFRGVPSQKKTNITAYAAMVIGAVLLVWFISSIRTMGLINKRYANKDATGRIKEDISTGREQLISAELTFFWENPVMGIGVGKTMEYREERFGILAASHNEVSRLLSEHGMFGVAALMLLVLVPLSFRLQNRNNYLFFAFFGFWFMTINHSSMRIAAPALLYALSLVNIVHEKKPAVHRQPVIG